MILLFVAAPSLAQLPANERAVSLTVTVSDQNGRLIGGLVKDRFSLLERNLPREVMSFRVDDRPVSVAILLDLSGSQSGKLAASANWVTHFIAGANASNDYLIVGFDKATRVLCDWGCDKEHLSAVLDAVSHLEPYGDTLLYDAVDLALKKMPYSSHARQVMVILSDGEDNLSKTTFSQLRRSLKQSDVMFYAVGLISKTADGSVIGMEGQAILDELAAITGGMALFPRSKDDLIMIKIAEGIAQELRYQYLLTFKASGPQDHELHKIKVKVTPAVVKLSDKTLHLKLRYREELYNP